METSARSNTRPPAPFEDMRTAPRFTVMLRTAKLVSDSGEFLCIVRDVSATGLRLRLFHAMPCEERLALELANGDHYFIEKVWEKDSEAGFRFAAPIDVDLFMAEASPWPKRALRLKMSLPAQLSAQNETGPARLLDLSQAGAKIESDRPLAMYQLVKLSIDGLESLYGWVRWRNELEAGIVFERTFKLDELARLAWDLQNPRTSHSLAPEHSLAASLARFA